ncbi:hypothetical protein MKW94_010073 [Papaver nudicaule]|uniref:Protein MIZU-KUSSEI 1-like n=1 Tax=Papaver nudicaule TaxID=74823 RepID=A0AA41S9K3_PAPNU|nr:hypothetical protein [Papaver nudicaule]
MTKSDNLCQYLCSCFSPPTSSSSKRRISNNHHKTYTVKKRISTSLRDDIPDDHRHQEKTRNQEDIEEGAEEEEESTDESVNNYPHQVNSSSKLNPPRSSKSMVIGTFFGQRRGHVCFCIQYHRLNSKPSLLLEFSMPTAVLIKEMQCGLVRIALESCNNHRNTTDNTNNNNNDGDVNNDTSSRRNSTSNVLPLLSIPLWTMCINGRKMGFASRRRTTNKDRLILRTMQSTTVGAGVIPSESLVSSSSTATNQQQSQEGGGEDGDVMYMRANYERVIGNIDSESFHLINPDGNSGQELSIFLLRSR